MPYPGGEPTAEERAVAALAAVNAWRRAYAPDRAEFTADDLAGELGEERFGDLLADLGHLAHNAGVRWKHGGTSFEFEHARRILSGQAARRRRRYERLGLRGAMIRTAYDPVQHLLVAGTFHEGDPWEFAAVSADAPEAFGHTIGRVLANCGLPPLTDRRTRRLVGHAVRKIDQTQTV